MWEPEIGWIPVRSGRGPATAGVWRAIVAGRPAVVKRLLTPEGDPAFLAPSSYAYWRREAEVAESGVVSATRGLRGAETLAVTEDDEGVTVVTAEVDPADNPGLFLARALGRFAAGPVPAVPWLARGQLRDRLARVEARGGWPMLGRTTASDVAAHLWGRRERFLALLDDAPQVLQHGDPTPANLVGRLGEDVVAIDWSSLGVGAVGADLGLLALGVREDFEPLLTAYVDGLGSSEQLEAVDVDAIATAASVSAVYTAFTRAEWALARVADGEGALAGKFRHPSVAPYLRALARLGPQVEALLPPSSGRVHRPRVTGGEGALGETDLEPLHPRRG